MSKDQQYLLDVNLPISFNEEDYIVANSNYLAHSFIKKWPDWGAERMSNIACIYGEAGAGKSHLSSIWGRNSGAKMISSQSLSSGGFEDENFLIDNIEDMLNEEVSLFNLFNHVLSTKRCLLITSAKAPSKLEIKLPDLRSRLTGIVSIEIARPDEKIIEGIITKYFSDAQIPLNAMVIKFLVTRINRSYAEISATLKALDKISLAEKRKVSIQLVKEVLAESEYL
jgi:chromosomal replication initiation ATPase DnaA